MKILLVLDTLNAGGAERSLVEIINTNLDPTVEFYVATLYGGGILESEVVLDSDRLVVYNLDGKYKFRKGRDYMIRLIKRIQPDLVHATLFRSEIISRLALLGDRKTVLIGSFVNDSYSAFHYRLKHSLVGKFKLAGIQAIDLLTRFRVNKFLSITESTKLSNTAALLLAKDKVQVIYRGRNIQQYAVRRINTDSFGNPGLLTTGRLIWRKGYRESLTAVAQSSVDTLSYRIAGAGVDETAIRQLAASLPNAHRTTFLGHVVRVADELAKTDYLLMPSHYEGLGGSLIEAMLSKVPIIASDIPVHREVTGGHALFFEVTNAASLTELLNNLPQPSALNDMVARAHVLATERYDIRHITAQTVAFYRKMIT